MNKVKFRIINKSKEGVTISTPKGPKMMPWDQFNNMFVIVDKVYAQLNNQMQKKHDRLEEMINLLTIKTLETKSKASEPSTSEALVLGTLADKIQKEFGFTLPQIIAEVQRRITILRDPNIPFFEKETPEEYRERHARQAEEKAKREKDERSYRQGTISNATESMANVKGADKLRELFK